MGAIGPTLCPDTAPPGTWILQQGTLDIGFDPGEDPTYLVGIKVFSVPIDFSGANNYVDAAIAFTTPNLADTEILDIGIPTPELGFALPGRDVIKSGRTTGVTQGTVDSINATVWVGYGSSCGTAKFVKQVVVEPGSFSDGGDSGSIVLDQETNKPVGLLFAGSPTQTIMNPILQVYLRLGVFVDGIPGPIRAQDNATQIKGGVVDPNEVERLKEIQARNEKFVFNIPGIIGIGIGLMEDGKTLGFIVYCEKLTPRVQSQVPRQLNDIPVRLIESGVFKAYR